MEMKTKVDLIKRLDEHECILSCSAQAPLSFLQASLEDFKAYICLKISEQSPVVEPVIPVEEEKNV